MMKSVYIQELKAERPTSYCEHLFPEEQLLELANIIQSEETDLYAFIRRLFHILIKDRNQHKHLDWNIGSTIQHFDAVTVIKAFKSLEDVEHHYLYDSIGLSWVLGEFKIKDTFVLEYLKKVVEECRDSDVWWRAAFSLEQLGEGDAVYRLKNSLKSKGVKTLDYYLDNIGDKESVIGILILSNNQCIKETIYPRIKEIFLHTDDRDKLTRWRN